MSWLQKLSELKKDFRGSTLISVREEGAYEIRTVIVWAFGRSMTNTFFSLNIGENPTKISTDISTESVSFYPENWAGELIGNIFFLRRLRKDPTHRGDWPHADSDLYIMVLSS